MQTLVKYFVSLFVALLLQLLPGSISTGSCSLHVQDPQLNFVSPVSNDTALCRLDTNSTYYGSAAKLTPPS